MTMSMPESMFQKLEEKLLSMVAELEMSRKELQRVSQENAILKAERESHMQKVHGLLSLMDSLNPSESTMQTMAIPMGKPVLMQG